MPSTPPPPPPPDTTITTIAALPPQPPPQQPPQQPPPRKFPAPCWTQDETHALINCYQDKWFSLRRRNLRTADWEAVAAQVNLRCPNQSPPKTSAQCRHKMEKLRKRYRAEKQRLSNLPLSYNYNPRFLPSSSWVFFDLMDSLEIGPAPGSTSGPGPTPNITFAVKDKNTPTFNVNDNKNNVNNGGGGRQDLGRYFDEILRSVGKSGAGIPTPPTNNKFKVNSSTTRHTHHHPINNGDDGRYFNEGEGEGDEEEEEYDQEQDHHGFNTRKRKFGGERVMRGGVPNGYPVSSSKRGRGGGGGEEVVGEMVASIRMLGEGLVKMEKMKMELMQDLERQRMEMEMNNSRLILESQHNIVTAFLHGIKKHHKNKVVKVVQME